MKLLPFLIVAVGCASAGWNAHLGAARAAGCTVRNDAAEVRAAETDQRAYVPRVGDDACRLLVTWGAPHETRVDDAVWWSWGVAGRTRMVRVERRVVMAVVWER